MTFDDACELILADPKADGYAKAYAKRAIGMEGRMPKSRRCISRATWRVGGTRRLKRCAPS